MCVKQTKQENNYMQTIIDTTNTHAHNRQLLKTKRMSFLKNLEI